MTDYIAGAEPSMRSTDRAHDNVFAMLWEGPHGHAWADAPDAEELLARARGIRNAFSRLLQPYQWAIDEIATRVSILRREFESTYDYSPIEHVGARVKPADSLLEKALRRGTELTVHAIRKEIRDIAGIRITCGFVSDVYWIAEMLSTQPDLRLLATKDYIARPKQNGYRSLHLIIEVPVFLAEHTDHVPVEVQIRTVAMDFWASTERRLAYKYHAKMPPELAAELDDAARVAADLDERMGHLRDRVRPAPRRLRRTA